MLSTEESVDISNNLFLLQILIALSKHPISTMIIHGGQFHDYHVIFPATELYDIIKICKADGANLAISLKKCNFLKVSIIDLVYMKEYH